eukprot:9503876-Pyramimonas_sp.AAC.1
MQVQKDRILAQKIKKLHGMLESEEKATERAATRAKREALIQREMRKEDRDKIARIRCDKQSCDIGVTQGMTQVSAKTSKNAERVSINTNLNSEKTSVESCNAHASQHPNTVTP